MFRDELIKVGSQDKTLAMPGLYVFSGPMRSGKTTAALSFAHSLQANGYSVEAYRPIQDRRHDADMIISQNPEVRGIPAQRVHDLGKIPSKFSAQVILLDEPFMWSDGGEEGLPDYASIDALEGLVSSGETIAAVSTLDKNYMGYEFPWHQELRRIGEQIADAGLVYEHVKMTGICELCPRDDIEISASTHTNLYINGDRQTFGSPNIPENSNTYEVYVPCCEECWASVNQLPEDYTPLFDKTKSA